MTHSTVSSLLRCSQAYCLQLCEKQTLEHGIAYYCERFADVPEANQFREVVLDDPANFVKAFEEAQEWFTSKGLTCHRWAPASGTASDELTAFLAERGFQRQEYTAMSLAQWVNLDAPQAVRVLPARAMRRAFRELVSADSQATARAPSGSFVESYEQRLDDPQLDMFVALIDQQAVGRCALYQVGDIARVMDLVVRSEYENRGVENALTAHALAFAKRIGMRNICLQIDTGDAQQRAWFERAGFVESGNIVEFHRGHAGTPT